MIVIRKLGFRIKIQPGEMEELNLIMSKDDFIIHDVQYGILNYKNGRNRSADWLYDQAFDLWKDTWENVIFPYGFTSDCFFNSDNILVLSYRGQVLALAVINYYDLSLKIHQHASYLKGLSEDHLLMLAGKKIMTIEYICTSKEWRTAGVGLGHLLVGITQEMFKSSPCDVSVGTARTDTGADKIAAKLGFRFMGKVDRYGLPCVLAINSKETVKEHSIPAIREWINTVWFNEVQLDKLNAVA